MDVYAIHNVVGEVRTRNTRMAQPTHRRYTERLFKDQRRVLRGRRIAVQESEVIDHIDEIRAKVAAGIIELRTLDGRLVDLDTLQPIGELRSEPLPMPLDDTVAKDITPTATVAQFEGGKPLDQLVAEAQAAATTASSTEDEEVDFSETTSSSGRGKRRQRAKPPTQD